MFSEHKGQRVNDLGTLHEGFRVNQPSSVKWADVFEYCDVDYGPPQYTTEIDVI